MELAISNTYFNNARTKPNLIDPKYVYDDQLTLEVEKSHPNVHTGNQSTQKNDSICQTIEPAVSAPALCSSASNIKWPIERQYVPYQASRKGFLQGNYNRDNQTTEKEHSKYPLYQIEQQDNKNLTDGTPITDKASINKDKGKSTQPSFLARKYGIQRGKTSSMGYLTVVLFFVHYTTSITALVTINKEKAAEGEFAILVCTFTGHWNSTLTRSWMGPPYGTDIIQNGISSKSIYTEDTSSASTTNSFSLTIHNFGESDDGIYFCVYGSDVSPPFLLRTIDSECYKDNGFIINDNAILNKPTYLTCITRDLTAIVQICDPLESIAVNCLIPNENTRTCFSGAIPNYSYCGGVKTCDTNIIIKSVEKENGGTWSCTHGATSFGLNITVLTLPSHIQETSSIESVSMSESTVETLTTKIECVYPVAFMNWEYVHAANNVTALGPFKGNCTDIGLTGWACEDKTAKTFICSFNLVSTTTADLPPGKYKVKASLVMEGEVNSTGISRILSTVITVPYLYDYCYCNIQVTVVITIMAVTAYAIIFIHCICKKSGVHLKIMHRVEKYRVVEITMLAFAISTFTIALLLLTRKKDKSCCIFTISVLVSVNIGSTVYAIILFLRCRKTKDEECQEENNAMELSPITQNKRDEFGKKALLISANPVQENDDEKFIKA